MKVTFNCLLALEGRTGMEMIEDFRTRLKIVDIDIYEQSMPGNGIMLLVVHPKEKQNGTIAN